MLRTLAAAVAALSLAACATGPHDDVGVPTPDAALVTAVAGPWRSDADKARDPARHPAETLAYWGVAPGVTVLELIPGGGYWTDILAPYAKATGGVYQTTAADLNNPALSDAARRNRAAFEARLAAKPDVYGNVTLVNFGARTVTLGQNNSVDVVFTARNIHNWMAAGTLDSTLAQIFAVLKPGGVFGVEEHRANAGEQDPKAPTGYVTQAYVIAAAEKAGFQFEGSAEINANPKDTKDHPFGVWTLPPTRQSAARGQPDDPAFDHSRYDAIGESDRMTLRFIKPKR